MGRTPCCDKNGLKKGPWTPEEDQKLIEYIKKHGYGNWRTLPGNAGLQRCGKSCRLRWTNYLRPDIKRGRFSFEEEETIIQLHSILGNKWSAIAARLPGRTDNEIKNYWNTQIRKKLLRMGIDPVTHSPRLDLLEISYLISPPQMDLSRMLGVQHLVNPEVIRQLAATSLMSSQDADQIQPEFLVQNAQENQLCGAHQLQNQEFQDIVYQPNNQEAGPSVQSSNVEEQFSSYLSDMSSQNSQWQTNVLEDCVPQVRCSYYRPSGKTALMYHPSLETSNFQSNSNLSYQNFNLAPVLPTHSSPAPLNSNSFFFNSSTDHNELESYCSNMLKLEILHFLDVNEYIL